MTVVEDAAESSIRLDEWLQAMQSLAERHHTDACTVKELSAHLNKSVDWVRNRLREAIARGLVECVRKSLTDLSGRLQSMPAYRLKQQPTKRKGAK